MDADVVVLGTGTFQSIVAAALSKAGFQVIHIDTNHYYGGDEASLTVDELVQWAQQRADPSHPQQGRFTSMTYTHTLPARSRQFSISLVPTIVPSIGPFIDTLIASGVSRYGGFKLLERVALFDHPGSVQMVPSGKEDIFRSKELSLVEKRRLMRFLMFAGSEFEGKNELQGREETPFHSYLRDVFSLDEKSARAITYALSFCNLASDQTLPALQRLRRYLRSAGRYGPSPFLVGHYGGLGELAQGFCRTSAVGGGTYILGRGVTSIALSERSFQADTSDAQAASPLTSESLWLINLEDFDQEVRCCTVVTSLDYLPSNLRSSPTPSSPPVRTFARGVAVIDKPIQFLPSTQVNQLGVHSSDSTVDKGEDETDYTVDTALLVFPPNSVEGGSTTTSVHMLIAGEASMSTPRGNWILHFTMPLMDGEEAKSASEHLQPYLEAALTLTALAPSDGPGSDAYAPLFTMFYLQKSSQVGPEQESSNTLIVAESFSPFFPEVSDQIATDAEACFWRVVETLKAAGRKPGGKAPGSDADGDEVDGFWPPLDDLGTEED